MSRHPAPVFYILLPKTGKWANHYNPVVEDEYLGKGSDSVFNLGMYTHPAGANLAIKNYQKTLKSRASLYRQQP